MTFSAKRFEGIVIGGSWGSIIPLRSIFSVLPANFSIPIAIALHRGSGSDEFQKMISSTDFPLKIEEPNDRDPFVAGKAFLAPADYHMLIDKDKTICLSTSDRTNHARPSIDELFETASDCFKSKLVGIILSGATSDGAGGLMKIKKNGGIAIVQNPLKASMQTMIRSAMEKSKVDFVYNADQIGRFLVELDKISTQNL